MKRETYDGTEKCQWCGEHVATHMITDAIRTIYVCDNCIDQIEKCDYCDNVADNTCDNCGANVCDNHYAAHPSLIGDGMCHCAPYDVSVEWGNDGHRYHPPYARVQLV